MISFITCTSCRINQNNENEKRAQNICYVFGNNWNSIDLLKAINTSWFFLRNSTKLCQKIDSKGDGRP